MENTRIYTIKANGSTGEIQVSDNKAGRCICIFKKDAHTDFKEIYEAYGFMVWTSDMTNRKNEYYPINTNLQTELTLSIMMDMWAQIEEKILLALLHSD